MVRALSSPRVRCDYTRNHSWTYWGIAFAACLVIFNLRTLVCQEPSSILWAQQQQDDPFPSTPTPHTQKQPYQPSLLEQYFIDHAAEFGWNDSVGNPSGCAPWKDPSFALAKELALYRAQSQEYQHRLQKFQAIQVTPGNSIVGMHHRNHSICEALQLHPQGLAPGIFNTTFLSKSTRGAFLEPLLPPMRDAEICFKGLGTANSLAYLLHDFAQYCRQLKHHSRIVLMDLGAALDFSKAGKESATLKLERKLSRFGFHLDHFYAFELQPKDPKRQVFDKLPPHLLTAIHWMNIGVSADPSSKYNPWNLLLQEYTQDDFIFVKLDIDTPHIENPLARQLLENPKLLELVDVFYFEHHVHLGELAYPWRGTMDGSILDSLQLFQQLRQKGVDAHFWV